MMGFNEWFLIVFAGIWGVLGIPYTLLVIRNRQLQKIVTKIEKGEL